MFIYSNKNPSHLSNHRDLFTQESIVVTLLRVALDPAYMWKSSYHRLLMVFAAYKSAKADLL